MAAKGLSGLILRNGIWHINKQYRGKTIRRSTYTSKRKEAEAVLIQLMAEIDRVKDFKERPVYTWRQAATKYLLECKEKPSIDLLALQLEHLDGFIGDLPLTQIHDGTLQPFIEHRKKVGFNRQAKNGVKNRTINIALNYVIAILNCAARSWRDENGLTWLETVPKITKLDEKKQQRPPYPLSWLEQRIFFKELNGRLLNMAIFKVNTGTREQEVCKLDWQWEVKVPELDTSIFIIPADFGGRTGRGGVKNTDERIVVLNDAAKQIIEAQRGLHPQYVFPCNGKAVGQMLNSTWKNARKRAANKYERITGSPANKGFKNLRVHDLKHTFGYRLRAAGVYEEDRKDLMGHKSDKSVTTHYSAPTLERMIELANKVLETDPQQRKSLTIIRKKAA
ncbi:integrase [Snodgrassella alvi]|jgi:integrase|uniref:Integrase n=2 Tax=Snodgrassella alvi TaxID=1196083 RepID=A0A2N9XPM4_9NEIS|nr:integrase [Snodgrassella alvi]